MDETQETEARPTIVCLCGSTRFWQEFQRVSLEESLAGRIVLSLGSVVGSDDDLFGHLPPEELARVKAQLDHLHLQKVALADEVLILTIGGYMDESTRRERDYALRLGKRVRYLEPIDA